MHFPLLQNVAAVTSTSTRTPIYKAFAKGENIGDVTAKGECVANVADLVFFPDPWASPMFILIISLVYMGSLL